MRSFKIVADELNQNIEAANKFGSGRGLGPQRGVLAKPVRLLVVAIGGPRWVLVPLNGQVARPKAGEVAVS